MGLEVSLKALCDLGKVTSLSLEFLINQLTLGTRCSLNSLSD